MTAQMRGVEPCRALASAAAAAAATKPASARGQTLTEKIVQRYAVDLPKGHVVHAGDFVYIRPAHVMTHDNTGAVMAKFKGINARRIVDPRQAVFTLDHDVQNTSDKNLAKYRGIEMFARDQGVDFYPAGRGIGHQIMVEEGYAFPQSLAVASDSHSNMYGGIGCLGTPVVRTDAVALWATGRTWWQVPPIAKLELFNALPAGVTGKDVIITLCGLFNQDEVLNYAVEFAGDGVRDLSIEDRLAIANMTTEWGALAGLFPVDDTTLDWLRARNAFLAVREHRAQARPHPRVNDASLAQLASNVLHADPTAYYAKTLSLDLASVRPHVSGPNHVKLMRSVHDLEKARIKVNKAYLVSCVNSRVEDLAQAARVIHGKTVAPHVQFYIAAASSEVQQQSEERGDWGTLLAAGARPLPAGCGPCVGLGTGLLEDGEVGISATNRNFKGRMGSPKAQAYLASPAVVAASAVAGYICGPYVMDTCEPVGSVAIAPPPPRGPTTVPLVDGFPSILSGEPPVAQTNGRADGRHQLLFCHQDNLNTDGIYPGKYTYVDSMTPAEMAAVTMENYDPNFVKLAKKGDILVGGYNFGTGSSREQAATSLKAAGIQLVLAGSFSETYKRNSVNNAFLALEAPELVDDLLAHHGASALTVRTRWHAELDMARAIAVVTTSDRPGERREYPITPVGRAAQELVLAGGLEGWIQQRLQA